MGTSDKDLPYTSAEFSPWNRLVCRYVRRGWKTLRLSRRDFRDVWLYFISIYWISKLRAHTPPAPSPPPPKKIIQLTEFTAYAGLSCILSFEDTGRVTERTKGVHPVFRNSSKIVYLKNESTSKKEKSSSRMKSAQTKILQEGDHNWRAFLSWSGCPSHNRINWTLTFWLAIWFLNRQPWSDARILS